MRVPGAGPGPSATTAPMMRSSRPSPLMSPAEETEWPDKIERVHPVDHKAADARSNVRKIDRGCTSRSSAQHHRAVAGIVARAGRRARTACKWRPNCDIFKAVAVNVAGGGDRPAGVIACIRSVDHEPGSTECSKINGHGAGLRRMSSPGL